MRRHAAVCVGIVVALAITVRAEQPSSAATEPLPSGALVRLGQARLALTGEAYALAFSPDNSTLVVASTGGLDPDDNLHVFDLHTGLERIQLPSTVTGNPRGMLLTFSPDGARLWSGDAVWDTSTWQKRAQQLPNRALALSADEKLLALHGKEAHDVALWDVRQGAQVAFAALSETDKYIAAAEFAPDGKTLAVSDYGGRLQLREVPSLKLLHEISGPSETSVIDFSFSPDGAVLAVPNAQGVLLYDVASGKLLRTCRTGDARSYVGLTRFAPNGKTLVGAGRNNESVFVWNPASGELSKSIPVGRFVTIESLAVSADSRFLAIGGNGFARSQTLRVIDLTTQDDLFPPTGGPTSLVTRIAYSPNSRQLATATSNGPIILWDSRTGSSLLTLHDSGDAALAYSPDGWMLGALGSQAGYHLWSADTGEDLVQRGPSRDFEIDRRLHCLALAPQLNELATGTEDGHLRVQSLATGAERSLFRPYDNGAVGAVAWSADGKIIATAKVTSRYIAPQAVADKPAPEAIQLWNAADGKLLKQLNSTIVASTDHLNREGGFVSLLFSPDSALVAAAHSSGPIVLWEVASGRQICEFRDEVLGPFCFSADSQMLLYAVGDSVVAAELASAKICFQRKLNSTQEAAGSDEPRRQFRMYRGGVISAIAAAADGRSFATALLRDNTVLLWSLAPDSKVSTPASQPLSEADMALLWNTLAGVDSPTAYGAMWRLVAAGDDAVAYIGLHFGPIKPEPPNADRIQQLIADLDSDVPAVRDKATDELTQLGAAAEPALRVRLTKDTSLEQRKRIEHLLAALNSPIQRFGGEPLRRIRAVRVLQQIDTKSAADLLTLLASGSPTARETRDAQRALQRRKELAKGR